LHFIRKIDKIKPFLTPGIFITYTTEPVIMQIGVIIPAYEEETRLAGVLRKVSRYIYTENICVIDDGSTDKTSDIAGRYGVHVIRFPENRGKGEALKAGIHWALKKRMDAMFTLDGDGQHDADDIPAFLEVMQTRQADVVLGTRSFRITQIPPDRLLSNKISSVLVSLAARKKIRDSQSGFRLFRTIVLKNLPLNGSLYELESEMLIRLGRRKVLFAEVPIRAVYGRSTSHIRRVRDICRFTAMWLSFMFKRKDSR
jgi:glycosyltransferase involved in cell wall biosynthesis